MMKRKWDVADIGFCITGGSILLAIFSAVILLALEVSPWLFVLLGPLLGISLMLWDTL